jgi:hypothetical protein
MRYFFHLRSASSSILDEEGVFIEDMAQAGAEILKALDEVRRENPNLFHKSSGWTLDVTDASGTVLFSIRLADQLG